MREPHLGRFDASFFLIRWVRPMGLVLALTLLNAETKAQPVSTILERSRHHTIRMKSVAPVPGWIRFCKQRPEECKIDASEPSTIPLTPQSWQILTAINDQVNAAISPVTDIEHWGVDDRWDLAEDGYGDCEDYQLVKRRLLVAAGFPRRVLRMTAVIDESGEPHAVLMIRTDRGDFILDNKRNAILPWRRTGYVFLQREGSTGSTWVALGGTVNPSATTAFSPMPRNFGKTSRSSKAGVGTQQ